MVFQYINKVPESKLMQILEDLRGSAEGWFAVHFHLSQLQEEYRSEYQYRIAINLTQDLLKRQEGALYTLPDGTILVVCTHVERALLEKLTFQMRYLYMDDPLCYDEQGVENPAFCTVYDVAHEWKKFESLCAKYRKSARTKVPSSEEKGDLRLPTPEKPKLLPEPTSVALPKLERTPQLSSVSAPVQSPPATIPDKQAVTLEAVTQMIARLNLPPLIRRQPICAVLADKRVRLMFDEVYVHIPQVRKTMELAAEFFANRWLFKHLTSLLDMRMIALIQSQPREFLQKPVSLNFNTETILSSAFRAFDAVIPPEAKVSIVIEVSVLDLFADMVAFKAALDELHRLGYRMCLDGLTTESFLHIDRAKIGVDLLKVQWNADREGALKAAKSQPLIDAVQHTGGNRIILCRCDDRAAVEYGAALGISLFQGRYLDRMIYPTSKVEN